MVFKKVKKSNKLYKVNQIIKLDLHTYFEV